MKKLLTFTILGLLLIGLLATAIVMADDNDTTTTPVNDTGTDPINDTGTTPINETQIEDNDEEVEEAEEEEQENEQKIEAVQEKNRIKFEERTGQECPEDCICQGVVSKCETETGREMTVYARSGNVIVQTKGVNATTQVTLYHHNNKTYGKFKNNETKEIKIMPDQAQEKIEARIQKRLGNATIELNEDGYYVVQFRKRARLFFLFLVREKVNAQVQIETGDIKIRNPWWGFLAKDIAEESE